MIVAELLSLPLFKDFKTLGSSQGINNEVSGTAIFDWENSKDVIKSFKKGEFVMTTLMRLKEKNEYDETLKAIYTVMDMGVCAIAIKKTYAYELPDGVLSYAEEKGIPVFSFENVYIDDIIYVIKNSLITDSLNNLQLNKLKEICSYEDTGKIRETALGINRYFHDSHFFCTITKTDDIESELIRSRIITVLSDTNIIYTIIDGEKSIFLIISSEENHKSVLASLKEVLSAQTSCVSGFSNINHGMDKFRNSIAESVYASFIASIRGVTFIDFSELNSDKTFFPLAFTRWGKDFYEEIDAIFGLHDSDYSSDFKKTLITYVKNDGNINKTAENLFQHSNTVRYRIKKITELLSIEDSYEAHAMMYTYVRLNSIYSLMESCELPVLQEK